MKKPLTYLQSKKGFTLIEVIASVIIIGIIFFGFFQLIIQSNAVAHSNNNKLILINLADAELERLQATQFNTYSELQTYINTHKSQKIIDNEYKIKIEVAPAKKIVNGIVSNESSIKLYNVTVTVSEQNQKKNSKSVAEGYVSVE